VAGPPVGLRVRRSREPTPAVKDDVRNAVATTPLGVLAEMARTRHEVEDDFADAQSSLGLARYETRSWVGWHPPLSVVAMAHRFLTRTRRDLGQQRRS
jgi:SRSO17 transposase